MPENPTTITAAAFGALTDPAQPMLTYYDDRTGERTELSGLTLANWAAKTANHLVDEAGLTPGDPVLVDLPEHWQTAGILLGAWWAGADVRLPGSETVAGQPDPLVVYTAEDRLDGHDGADEVLVASLDAFALPLRDLPPGVGDYGTAVRVHGDRFSPVSAAAGGPALDGRLARDVLGEASAAAERSGIPRGGRVLSVREWHTPDGVVANLLAPLVVGAGLVWVGHPASADDVARRAATEKADIVLT